MTVQEKTFVGALTRFNFVGATYLLSEVPNRDGILALYHQVGETDQEYPVLAEFERLDISDTDWLVKRIDEHGNLEKGLLAFFVGDGTWRYFWGTNREMRILITFAGISQIEVILLLSRLIILGEI